ncbi:MAG: drug/metabolite exporter YedA [Xanthomonadaceae bacterium]|nr:drug/metabolite exporter YedA [Xanthomonadaceae bacterium]
MRQCGYSAAVGFLLLNVGNGAVVYAQQSVGSALAATVVATMPLWASLFGGIWGQWPRKMQWIGLVVGFSGILLLNIGGDFAANPLSAALLVTASVSWAFGSVWSRRIDLPKGAMSTACQMLSAGLLFLAASWAKGESWQLVTTPKAMAALAYLALFGSVIAFSAYIYLVQTVTPQLATSYAYVNPVIALLFGVGLGGELFVASELAAMALVLFGVLLIVRYNRPPPVRQPG